MLYNLLLEICRKDGREQQESPCPHSRFYQINLCNNGIKSFAFSPGLNTFHSAQPLHRIVLKMIFQAHVVLEGHPQTMNHGRDRKGGGLYSKNT